MKKFLTLFFITIIAVESFCASAQNTPFSINTFCQLLSKSGPNTWSIPTPVFNKIMGIKSEKAIYSSLLKAGFSCYSKKNATEYNEGLGEYETYIMAKYSKTILSGKIFVDQEGCNVTITFPNISERNKFLQTVKAEQKKGYIYNSPDYYWVGVRVEADGVIVRVVCNGAY